MKLKIKIRREVRMVAALIGLSFLIAFSERKQMGAVCKSILVEIDNINDNHFLDEADVMHLVETSGQPVKGINLDRINLKAIETKLKYDKHIREAELFADLKGNLIAHVRLRRPIARIAQEDAPDAYISEEGVIMGVSEKFTSRVMVISGKFVKQLLEAEDLMKMEEGRKLMQMIAFIREDPFWNAQVAQMDINARGEIDIYPQITGQLVQFGTTDGFEEKLRKLLVFYKEVLPSRGWTKYERINLKYAGQVIAE